MPSDIYSTQAGKSFKPANAAPEMKFTRLAVERVAPDGAFEGYASVFGVTDQGGDIVAPGAFRRSLEKRPAAQIRMLWQHDPAEPIGIWDDIVEDAHGLRVHGRLLPEIARARELLSLMRAGAVDGLSIGFRTIRARRQAGQAVRTLIEVDLWEISVVTFPMNESARIAAVKQIGTLREFEAFLRDAGGFTRAEAKRLAARGYAGIAEQRDAEPELAQFAQTIRRAKQTLQMKG